MRHKLIIPITTFLFILIIAAGKFYDHRLESGSLAGIPKFSLGASVGNVTKLLPKREESRAKPVFPEVKIAGGAAIVYDIEKGQTVFAKNENKPLPLASITKLMTALVANEKLSAEENVNIDRTALLVGSRLKEGESYSVENLTDITLVGSLNEGAAALALATSRKLTDATFIDIMNQKASEIGMTKTHFINETGLDLNGKYGGSYGSALDVAKLLSYIIKREPSLTEATRHNFIVANANQKKTIGVSNTNTAIDNLPGVIASKTGFTDLADGNLAVVIDAGIRRPFAIVVLGSSKSGRFSDVKALTEATFNYIKSE